MKITIVQGAFFPVPPIRGGAVEKIWYQLGREFASRGHTVMHISRNHDEPVVASEDSAVCYRRVRGYDQPANRLLLKWRDLIYSSRACRLVPKSDVIVTNTFWAPILMRRCRGIYVNVERMPKGQ